MICCSLAKPSAAATPRFGRAGSALRGERCSQLCGRELLARKQHESQRNAMRSDAAAASRGGSAQRHRRRARSMHSSRQYRKPWMHDAPRPPAIAAPDALGLQAIEHARKRGANLLVQIAPSRVPRHRDVDQLRLAVPIDNLLAGSGATSSPARHNCRSAPRLLPGPPGVPSSSTSTGSWTWRSSSTTAPGMRSSTSRSSRWRLPKRRVTPARTSISKSSCARLGPGSAAAAAGAGADGGLGGFGFLRAQRGHERSAELHFQRAWPRSLLPTRSHRSWTRLATRPPAAEARGEVATSPQRGLRALATRAANLAREVPRPPLRGGPAVARPRAQPARP